MKDAILVENLREVKHVFDKAGIRFWLDAGTLLGAVRERKIIEWDLDVDLGTWHHNVEAILRSFRQFTERGFKVVFVRRTGSVAIERFGYNIGVNLYRKQGKCAWTVATTPICLTNSRRKILYWLMNVLIKVRYANPEAKRLRKSEAFSFLIPSKVRRFLADVAWFLCDRHKLTTLVIIPKHHFENLSTIDFYGMKFSVPCDTEKYLAYRYGNWKTPVKNWKFKDDGAINREIRLCDFNAET